MPFFGEMPEEVQQFLSNMRDSSKVQMHTIESIWEKLSEDELVALRDWLSSIASSGPVSLLTVAHMVGVIDSTISRRFDLCIWDSQNHNEEVSEFLAPIPEVPEPQGGKTPTVVPESQQPDEPSKADIYHLKRNSMWTPDGTNGQPWICRDCGYGYASISDRMENLPGPENCPGCRHKAKFG